MQASVLIPTRARPERLVACLRALAAQTLPASEFEVLVGLDGPDDRVREAARAADPTDRLALTVVEFPREGNAAIKNRLLERARAETVVFMNDDVLAEPPFLEAHVRAQRAERSRALILGDSPWIVRRPDRLFDRLIRDTSMIFFYDQMPRAGAAFNPRRDWGFRHAWTLNLSAPLEMARAVGGFYHDPTQECGYEDIEFAWRLRARFDAPVLFRPEAVAWHDHPYEPDAYLDRERALGRQAWGFARASPECACEVFGRDITSPDELAYSRAFVQREATLATRLTRSFRALADTPADALAGPHDASLLRVIYEHHLPLKRWCWRWGLLAAAEGAAPVRWEDVVTAS